MSHEFVARKGLISLKSSSFDETLHVSGSISSPVEAYLTASWAITASYAISSSYASVANTLIGSVETASYVATASWAYNAITASYVISASYAISSSYSLSSSYGITSSYSISSSYAITSSYSEKAMTASYALSGSWVDVAQTASVLATSINYLGVTECVRTGGFAIAGANTWYDLILNTDTATSSYFSHPNNTAQFTCSSDGFYQFIYWANVVKVSGGSSQVAGLRVLKNGSGWTGSYVGSTYASNNSNQVLSSAMFERISSGSTFQFQIAADSTTIAVQQFPTSSLNPATISYSAKVIISRM